MTGCLTAVILALVLAAGSMLGPPIAEALIGSSLASTGFDGRNTTIEVTTDPGIEVLVGRADRVRIRSERASFEGLHAATVDLTLVDVGLGSGTAGAIEGTLIDVDLPATDGSVVRARSVTLSGPPESVQATVAIAPAVVAGLVQASIARQLGFEVGSITLEAPDRLVFDLGLIRATGRFTIEPDGALALIAEVPGDPRIGLLASGQPLVFREVSVAGDLVLVGTLDLTSLLR